MNLITYNDTGNITSFSQAMSYSANTMHAALGYDVFGVSVLLIVFMGFYVVGSKYSQERALAFALFMTSIASFIMVSGGFLDPIWLMISIICLMVAAFAANRVN